jgi:superfamily II DNA or RNA helicase
MVKVSLNYHSGTIIINGISNLPSAAFDPRINSHRAPAHYYMRLIKHIRENNIDYIDNVLDLIPSAHLSSDIKNHNYVNYHGDNNIDKSSFSLRDYQQQAVRNWIRAKMRGCVACQMARGKKW